MSSAECTRRNRIAAAVLVVLSTAAWFGVTPGAADASPNQFRISPTKVAFGDVPVGSSVTKTVDVKNISGTSQVMSGSGGGAGVFGGSQNCQGATLAAGASCEMFYTFAPTGTGVVTGSTNGTWNGQPFSLKFSGTGTAEFKIGPTSLAFGTVALGGTSPMKSVKVTNLANQSVVMSGSGGGAGIFGGSQDCQGETLAAGASCEMFYAFTPTTTGPVKGSTNGTWNGQFFSVKFSGTGTAEFKIAPTSLAFGKVSVGTTSPMKSVKVTNLANQSVVMSGSGGGAGIFGGSQDCQGATLAAGASCEMFYAFSPTTTGPVKGSTNGTWNGQSFALKFSGTGVAP